MKENFVMTLEIKFKADENEKEQHNYSGQLNPSSLKGFHGLYMLPLKRSHQTFFRSSHLSISIFSCKLYDLQISILIYTESCISLDFPCGSISSFQIESCTISVKEVRVKALSEPASWELVSDGKSTHGVSWGSQV